MKDQQKAINELRANGYLVCIWSPEEIKDCDIRLVENRVIELCREVVDDLRGIL